MSARGIARRYAGALFDVAKRNGRLDAVERQIHLFGRLLDDHPELRRVLETPAVGVQKKRAILEAVLLKTGGIDGEVRQLLLMLADRDRLASYGDIAAAFADRLRQERRVLQAEIVTAERLPDAQRALLGAALEQATGSDLTLTERVDPSIIGGVVAKVGSVVFDGSITRQLERLKQELLGGR